MNQLYLSKSGLRFNQIIDRENAWNRPTIKIKESKIVNEENVQKYYRCLSTVKRICVPKFNEYKTRDFPNDILPSYMTDIHNRITLTTLSAEMIKTNKFAESEELVSHKKSPRSRKSKVKLIQYKSSSNQYKKEIPLDHDGSIALKSNGKEAEFEEEFD